MLRKRKGFEGDPVLEVNVSTGEFQKDTHEEQQTSLDDLTIYQFKNVPGPRCPAR